MKNTPRTARGTIFTICEMIVLAGFVHMAHAAPTAPTDLEVKPTGTSGAAPISVTWDATPLATSYIIYRGTSSGGETKLATSNTNSYLDSAVVVKTVYYYKVAAVDSAGISPLSAEEETPTPLPVSSGSGNVAGVTVGNSLVYDCKEGLRGGFDWFETYHAWFPEILGSSGAVTPGQLVVDMAYADEATLAFNNVDVPTSGLYTIDWRYAFAGGLFPAVWNRHMGLKVNGTVFTSTQRFTRTGSFDVYEHSALQVHLNAGRNSVVQFAVSDHGLSRVDQLTVTPASASSPSGPTKLSATATQGEISLSWTASNGATEYQVYRGTASDGEANAPIATVSGSTTKFIDKTSLTNGKTYYYNVSATNSVGVSPDSNEVAVVFIGL
jgi:fibronectin type 3 domain-containing protein